jgi:uncharacterized protein YgbK (DUF1537 family)
LLVTIIADDLTGAADTAIAFGAPAYVSLGTVTDAAEIVAIDTDSRAVSPEIAAKRVYAAAREAFRLGTRHLYKKMDSTLRGNVSAELTAAWRAARDVLGHASMVVAPAWPSMGRTVRGGRVFVHGVPLEKTEHSQGGPSLAGMVAGLPATVFDAETEDALAFVARIGVESISGAAIWAGSAGLARHLPAALGLPRPKPSPLPGGQGPVLALMGSRSALAREQAAGLAQLPGVAVFSLDPSSLEVGGVESALSAGKDVLLHLAAPVDLQRAPLVAAAFGREAARHAGRLGGLIATGGDIARAALTAMGAPGLRLLGELEPGVPFGMAGKLRVVTKAGAFGTSETLRNCLLALRAARG